MTVLETIAVAFSMFSALPMPQFPWTERNMRYALCAFPLIGLVVGLLCWAAAALCGFLHLPGLLQGAFLCVIPVLVTGGIHLDGYCDTWDALASHGTPERKREILNDPHIGTFAAIRLCSYFVLTFALWASLPAFRPGIILPCFCLSRTMSALAVAAFPLAKDTGLAHTFAEAADKKRVRAVLAVLHVLLCLLLCVQGLPGIMMTAAANLTLVYYYFMSKKQFGGLSGDLAGWFLQTTELWMLMALVMAEYLEVVI